MLARNAKSLRNILNVVRTRRVLNTKPNPVMPSRSIAAFTNTDYYKRRNHKTYGHWRHFVLPSSSATILGLLLYNQHSTVQAKEVVDPPEVQKNSLEFSINKYKGRGFNIIFNQYCMAEALQSRASTNYLFQDLFIGLKESFIRTIGYELVERRDLMSFIDKGGAFEDSIYYSYCKLIFQLVRDFDFVTVEAELFITEKCYSFNEDKYLDNIKRLGSALSNIECADKESIKLFTLDDMVNYSKIYETSCFNALFTKYFPLEVIDTNPLGVKSLVIDFIADIHESSIISRQKKYNFIEALLVFACCSFGDIIIPSSSLADFATLPKDLSQEYCELIEQYGSELLNTNVENGIITFSNLDSYICDIKILSRIMGVNEQNSECWNKEKIEAMLMLKKYGITGMHLNVFTDDEFTHSYTGYLYNSIVNENNSPDQAVLNLLRLYKDPIIVDTNTIHKLFKTDNKALITANKYCSDINGYYIMYDKFLWEELALLDYYTHFQIKPEEIDARYCVDGDQSLQRRVAKELLMRDFQSGKITQQYARESLDNLINKYIYPSYPISDDLKEKRLSSLKEWLAKPHIQKCVKLGAVRDYPELVKSSNISTSRENNSIGCRL